jgi:hypothetical protein
MQFKIIEKFCIFFDDRKVNRFLDSIQKFACIFMAHISDALLIFISSNALVIFKCGDVVSDYLHVVKFKVT